MRTLEFIVTGQILRPDPNCDFSGLVPGSSDYLKAVFTFSKEWEDTLKVVGFYSRMGKEFTPQILKDGKSCVIPAEALKGRIFKIQILGKNGLVTNKLEVDQKGGSV